MNLIVAGNSDRYGLGPLGKNRIPNIVLMKYLSRLYMMHLPIKAVLGRTIRMINPMRHGSRKRNEFAAMRRIAHNQLKLAHNRKLDTVSAHGQGLKDERQ